MYNPNEILDLVDDRLALFLLFGGMSFGALAVYYYEIIRLGLRDRCAPLTVLAAGVFLAHDANFVINFDDWFNTYDHWMLQLFWGALCVTTVCEFVFISLIIRFGREELAPHLNQQQWTASVVGGIGACIIGWGLLKEVLDDPLYITSFMLTITWCLPSATNLYLRRGVQRGMSVRQAIAYFVMALGWVLCTTIVMEITAFWWLAVCALTLVWALVMLRAVMLAPPYTPVATPAAAAVPPKVVARPS